MRTRSSASVPSLEESFASAESDTEIENMAFETENGTDEAGAHSKLSSVKVAYDPKDIDFFFINLESAMAYSGIKSQQTKRFCLLGILPNDVKTQFKGVIKATATGERGYKKVKDAVLEVFGPKPGDDFAKAAKLMLTDKPSMLANEIISLVCSHDTPLQNCCCEGAVLYLWTRQLPGYIKSRIAGKSIKAPESLKEVLKLADAVHASNSQKTQAQVAAVQSSSQEVSAATRSNARGGARGRGRGRGQGGATQARPNGASSQLGQNWGPRHPDNPPDGCCRQHWKWGTNSYFCSDIATCPWKSRIVPRPTQPQPQPNLQKPPA